MTTTEHEITRRETRGSVLLWIGLLTGPLAWLLHLTISYSLEEWFACSPATQTPGEILGIGVKTLVVVINAVLALATIAAGLIAFRCWREIDNGDEIAGRARWMALAGIMNSVLYGTIIVFGFAPAALLSVCEVGP
jgi:hypothetical protein